MNCPYCQNEMTPGYMQSRDGVYWTPKKRLFAPGAWLNRNNVSLANIAENDGYAVRAWHCASCRKVVIDYAVTE